MLRPALNQIAERRGLLLVFSEDVGRLVQRARHVEHQLGITSFQLDTGVPSGPRLGYSTTTKPSRLLTPDAGSLVRRSFQSGADAPFSSFSPAASTFKPT